MIWLGFIGYVFYTYTGASFAYAFNRLLPVYVALFSLSIFTLVAGAVSLDLATLVRSIDSGVPRKPVAVFLALIAILLSAAYLGQILPFYTTGTVPEPIELADAPTLFVYVLDLGLVVPLALIAAGWLWRGSPWGYVLAGCLLIKAATMGFALLSMTWFSLRSGLDIEVGLAVLWGLIAIGGTSMSPWFFRHWRG